MWFLMLQLYSDGSGVEKVGKTERVKVIVKEAKAITPFVEWGGKLYRWDSEEGKKALEYFSTVVSLWERLGETSGRLLTVGLPREEWKPTTLSPVGDIPKERASFLLSIRAEKGDTSRYYRMVEEVLGYSAITSRNPYTRMVVRNASRFPGYNIGPLQIRYFSKEEMNPSIEGWGDAAKMRGSSIEGAWVVKAFGHHVSVLEPSASIREIAYNDSVALVIVERVEDVNPTVSAWVLSREGAWRIEGQGRLEGYRMEEKKGFGKLTLMLKDVLTGEERKIVGYFLK